MTATRGQMTSVALEYGPLGPFGSAPSEEGPGASFTAECKHVEAQGEFTWLGPDITTKTSNGKSDAEKDDTSGSKETNVQEGDTQLVLTLFMCTSLIVKAMYRQIGKLRRGVHTLGPARNK